MRGRVASRRPDAQSGQCRRGHAHPDDADRLSLQNRLADDEQRPAVARPVRVDVSVVLPKLAPQMPEADCNGHGRGHGGQP